MINQMEPKLFDELLIQLIKMIYNILDFDNNEADLICK